jgi:hypothetical protein
MPGYDAQNRPAQRRGHGRRIRRLQPVAPAGFADNNRVAQRAQRPDQFFAQYRHRILFSGLCQPAHSRKYRR